MVNLAERPIRAVQIGFLIPSIIGAYLRFQYLQTHDGVAPSKKFTVPTRIKIIDHWMLTWPLLAMIAIYLLIQKAIQGKYKVKSLTEGRVDSSNNNQIKKKMSGGTSVDSGSNKSASVN